MRILVLKNFESCTHVIHTRINIKEKFSTDMRYNSSISTKFLWITLYKTYVNTLFTRKAVHSYNNILDLYI